MNWITSAIYIKIFSSFLFLLVLIGCGGDGTGSEEGFLHVKMFDNVFIPPISSTPVGGKVRFVNIGGNPHNAISVDKSWSTEKSYGNISVPHGAHADVTYPEEGDFPYFCSFHASSDGKVGIGTSNPGAKLDVNGGLNITGRMQIWRWSGNLSASQGITLLTHTTQWLQSYCMVFVKVSAGWQNSAIWDVWCDGYGTSYCVSTKKMGDNTYHSVVAAATNNYGYINLNNLHTAQVNIEVNVYSFSSYSVMNYTSSYMTLA
jgi:plastocyanin